MINRILMRRCSVVYQLPLNWDYSEDIPSEFKHVILNQDQVRHFFRREPTREKTFGKFLIQGFRGITWYTSSEWISYAWISTPETLGPPHLPYWIRKLPVYWIFYCRTKEQYQGRGLYKASISLLARWAREKAPNAPVYIDTALDNIPSRRAIKSVGFLPAGIITTLELKLPKVSYVLWGKWDKEASGNAQGD